ncbi:hypothetical protein B0181_10595 [Moraxella caviae]|uniref:Phage head morphogenesis protein, SPP1 gp7 family n=3 Tax=Moraxella caviae TaxID=34060 RepID=A0A1S9ZV52_9GAMM|nr:hypothetical protein B0181_10595 [Moraxella caviae]
MSLMMTYNLKELLGKLSKTVRLPFIANRLSSERIYQRKLGGLVRRIGNAVADGVLPAYAAYVASGEEISGDEMMAMVGVGAAIATAEVINWAKDFVRGEMSWHNDKFVQSIKTATNLDVSALVRVDEAVLDDMVSRNVSLIKNLSDDTQNQIKQAVINAKMSKRSADDLKADIAHILGKQDKRATLIATDQTIKITADLNEYRQRQAGVRYYRWESTADGRVRQLHRQLHGRIYEWGKPTDAEQGLPPGKPIRCRCRAVAVVPAFEQVSFKDIQLDDNDSEVQRLLIDLLDNKPKLHEAMAAAQYQAFFGVRLIRPKPEFVNGNAKAGFDYLVEQTGKRIDFMFTMHGYPKKKIEKLNQFFAHNDTTWADKKDDIQSHLRKADIVPLDLRYLTDENRTMLIQHVLSLPVKQQKQILFIE